MDIIGGRITLKAGEQVIDQPITVGDGVDTPAGDIVVEGQGTSTVLKRGLDLSAGLGLFNVYGYNIVFRNFVIDGGVTTSSVIDYLDMSEPMADALTANTSFWIFGGAAKIRFENVWVRNSGGYAILLDAQTADINDFKFIGGGLENCRPHLIGYPLGDGGGWNGGIFAKNNGATGGAVNGMLVQGATFKRMGGNAIWQHSNDFSINHKNLNVTGCHFEDLCRDGVMPGNCVGGSVSYNTFYRVGYITTTNTDTAAPCWPENAPNAVALDTTGLAKNFAYNGNTFVDLNATAIDGDGLHDSVIHGNTMSVSDSVSGYGPGGIGNFSTGIQPSNSYFKHGGRNLTITGNTIRNMGNTAISGSNLKGCNISANNIVHPSGAYHPPIILFNKPGYDGGVYTTGDIDSAFRSHGNTITANQIEYSGSRHAIEEIVLAGGADYAYKAADVNRIFNNVVTGGAPGEFKKSSDSGSFVGFELATTDNTSTSADVTRIQREGTEETATTKLYSIVGGTSKQLFQISDEAFINVSENGAAGTGVIATGNRGTLAWPDAVGTGKVALDGFLSFHEGTFDDDEADLLDDEYILIRKDGSDLQISRSTSGGARVWQVLGQSVAGSDKQVQFNDDGELAGSASFTFDKTAKALTLTGSTGTPSIVVATSYIQSAEGFYSPGSASTTVNVPSGGVTSLSHVLIRNDAAQSLYFVRNSGSNQRTYSMGINGSGELILSDDTGTATRLKMSTAGLISNGNGSLAFDQAGALSTTGVISTTAGLNVTSTTASNSIQTTGGVTAVSLISVRNDGDVGLVVSRTSSTARAYGFLVDSSGDLFLKDVTGTANRLKVSTAGVVSNANGTLAFDQSGNLTAAAVVLAAGVNVINGSSAYNSIQTNAGVFASLGLTTDQALYLKTFATSTMNAPGSGYGALAHKANSEYWIYTGSGWTTVDFSTVGSGVTSLTGTSNRISVSASTGAITLSTPQDIHSGATPTFAGMSLSAQLNISTSLDSGLAVAGSGQQLVCYVSSAGGPVIGTTSNHPVIFFANNAERMRIATSGAVTMSSTLVTAGAIQSTVSGVAFQAGSGNFQADSSGNVSGAGSSNFVSSYRLNSVTVIDSSRNATFVGTNTTNLTVADHASLTGNRQNFSGFSYGGAIIGSSATSTFYSISVGGGNRSNNTQIGSLCFHGFGPNATLNSSLSARILATCDTSTSTDYGAHIDFETVKSASVSGTASGNRMRITSYGNILIANTTDDGSGAKLQVTGFGNSTVGWSTSSTATDSIKSTLGGVTAKYLIGTSSLTLTTDASAGLSSSGQARFRFDGSNVQLSINGGSYATLGASSVSSITGTSNQVVASASTGAVTLSLPQNIHTGATPTWAGLTLNGHMSISTSLNSGFSIAGSGQTAIMYVSSAGGPVIGSTSNHPVIFFANNGEKMRIATSGAVTMSSTLLAAGAIQSSASGANICFQANGGQWQVDGNGNSSGAGSANYIGGFRVSGTTVIDSSRNATVVQANATTFTVADHASLSGNRQNFLSFSYGGAIIGGAGANTFYTLSIGGGNRNVNQQIGAICFHGFGPNATLNSSLSGRISSVCDTSTSSDYGAHIDFETIKSASVSGTASGNRMRITSYGNILIANTTDDGSGAKLQVTGFGNSTVGWSTPNTATDALKATLGGCTAKYLIGTSSLTLTTDASAGLSSSGQARFRFDGTNVQLSVNGGSYSTLGGPTYSAGTGVTISSGVISIGQAVGTSSTPTFATMNVTGAVQSNSTGSSIAFQTANSNYSVDGNGNISGAAFANLNSGYKVGGTTVIDSSRNATLTSVSTTGAVQAGGTGSTITFQNSSTFAFQVNGQGDVSGREANFSQGYKVGGNTVVDSSRNITAGGNIQCGSSSNFSVAGGYFGQDRTGGISLALSGGGSITLYFKGGILYATV